MTAQLKTDFVFSAEMPDLSTTCLEVPALFVELANIHYVLLEQPIEQVQYPPPDMGARLSLLQQYLI